MSSILPIKKLIFQDLKNLPEMPENAYFPTPSTTKWTKLLGFYLSDSWEKMVSQSSLNLHFSYYE